MNIKIVTHDAAPRPSIPSSRVLGVALLIVCAALTATSQTYTGRILGTVSDKSGGVIVGAKVTITDVQRGVSRALVTDAAGQYVAPDLIPGQYAVRVEQKGFKTYERKNVQIEVARDVTIDVVLQPGEATETVIVTEEVPLLNTTSSELGGTLSNAEINELPLNGRNYENLLQLRPGVVRYPGGGFSTTSTYGLRAEDNAYLFDGLFDSEPFSGQSIINGAGIGGDSATILPIDAIQEFNLIENPPAEYGWKPGAIVNVGIKSGTNSLHGTSYGFYRDGIFDARNYFDTVGTPKTPRALKQFGTTLGGPIVKDKLFFFGGYEGQRYQVGNSVPLTVPTTVPGLGSSLSIPDAIAAVYAASPAAGLGGAGLYNVSPTSLKVAGCTFTPPATTSCNGTGFPTNTGVNGNTIIGGFPNTSNADNAIGKVDYHLNDRNTISGSYFFGNERGSIWDAFQLQPQWLTDIHTRAQVLGTSWTWVPSSHWVNELRFGYNRLTQPTFTADHLESAASLGINDGVTNPLYGGLPRLKIKGFGGMFETLGGFKWPKLQGPDQRYQIVDHISYTFGKHALKFGGEIHRDSFHGGAFGDGKGYIIFSGSGDFPGSSVLEDFFAGIPSGQVPFPTHALVGATPILNVSNWSEAAFIQDDWRIRKNLTINLGLRYEYNGVISESNDMLGNFSPTIGLEQVGQQISQPYHGDHTNFAPRLGMAWDPFGTGTTVVRAGFGLIYETVNWESFLAFNNVFGLGTVPTGGAGVTPGGGKITAGIQNILSPTQWDTWGNVNPEPFALPAVTCSNALPCGIGVIDPNVTTPYVLNWTLNVQHAFTNKVSLEVGYVANHGTNLMGIRDINQPVFANETVSEQSGRPFNATFPFLSNIYQLSNEYRSNYDGLQATFTSRNYHGLTTVAGYTFAHALDDVGANWDFGAGLGLPLDSTHPGREYASSDFDMRHRFTLSIVYDVPGIKSPGQMLEGWQLVSIVSLYSAQPWGPMDTGDDFSQTGEGVDRWDFVGNPSDFKSDPRDNLARLPQYFAPAAAPAPPLSTIPAICQNAATTPGMQASLAGFGCYVSPNGRSAMVPPAFGTFGTMGRNTFRDTGFRNWDFSLVKNWKYWERLTIQLRSEFFNILNHPNFANPFGGQNGFGMNDPSVLATGFGCGCATPDVAATNPVIGSGGSRSIQLGLKLIY